MPKPPKHPEISVNISESENSLTVIGKVTRALRNQSKYDSISGFMKEAFQSETDEQFMAVVRKYVNVR
jgi:hypothetical protein